MCEKWSTIWVAQYQYEGINQLGKNVISSMHGKQGIRLFIKQKSSNFSVDANTCQQHNLGTSDVKTRKQSLGKLWSAYKTLGKEKFR